jgi:dCTP deaminase
MILGGQTILDEVKAGNIQITPFDESRINPNSYNLTLGNKLLVYDVGLFTGMKQTLWGDTIHVIDSPLDMKRDNPTKEIIIPEDGLLIEPGRVYLGTTNEFTFTDKYVPMLEGRSSIGRLGLMIHVTAGFGDVGFAGKWTLEIVPTQPIVIYPNVEIAQIYYHTVTDNSVKYTSRKYNNQDDVVSSKLYMDFENK